MDSELSRLRQLVTLDWKRREIREAEADGTPCQGCGDIIYLNKRDIWVPILFNGVDEGDGIVAVELCQSCADCDLEIQIE